LGLLELGLSRPECAREQLAPLPELTRRYGLGEPGVVCWQPDWIEANIRLGELESAQQALTLLEREARTVKRTWALAAAARYRGLIAPDDQFEGHFARALEWHELTPTPFDRARTRLCYGEQLRRAGQRRRAREQLQQALESFRRLGADPWASQAENELSATGATHTRPAHAPTGRSPQQLLTPQELQVALAVAEGKSNKEAAAALFLSPKTIEFHLGHIYRKLDLHTRTQLARTMLTPGQDATPPPAAATPAAGSRRGTVGESV
jgi:DNA-binding CsgD family transcriptional regulator